MKVVLAIGGHDPGGGAGIQADIGSIAALGAHPLTLITALTVQDTNALQAFQPVSPDLLLRQFRVLQQDIPIHAVKLGMLGSVAVLDAVLEMLASLPGVPVICDPVLAAGGGGEASDSALRSALVERLLPLVTLLTPNTVEARRLSGEDDLDAAAVRLLAAGLPHLLLTGSHEAADPVVHRWQSATGDRAEWSWARLPGEYHGSGCTLSAAIAALLAQGIPLKMALGLAQAYTYDSLKQAYAISRGQLIPARHSANGPRGD
jgi:hydroxymethylpyrimidine/phosphomethylpyrimidine kinase